MSAKTGASFFLRVNEEWGIDELVGLLGEGFANELQLAFGSENGLKELEAGFGKGWERSEKFLRTLLMSGEVRVRGKPSFSFPFTF